MTLIQRLKMTLGAESGVGGLYMRYGSNGPSRQS